MKFFAHALLSYLLNNGGSIHFGINRFQSPRNLAEEFSDAGGDDDGYEDDGGEVETDGDDDLIGESWEDAFEGTGLDPKKYGLKEEEDQDELEPEGSQEGEEAQGEKGQATDDTSILETLNKLGMIHNELPIKVESLDQAKNLIQKGYDYEAKTSALSQERTQFDAEKTQATEEFQGAIKEFNERVAGFDNQIKEMQQFHFALEQLQKNDPDAFAAIQAAYDDVGTKFNNPIVNQQMQAINKEFAAIREELKSRESKLIVDEFDREKQALSATEQSFKELGVTIDWNAVKNEWAKTGLPLKQVVGSLYIDHVAKAQASKAKVATTKAKVSARPTGAAGSSRPGNKATAIDPNLKGMALAEALYKRHLNK
jgi:hypothetical protein